MGERQAEVEDDGQGLEKTPNRNEVEEMRELDKTKKSNIKCENCLFFVRGVTPVREFMPMPYCKFKDTPKNYWNRCKHFEWGEK